MDLWNEKIPYYNEEFQTEDNQNTATITPFIIDDNKKHSCIIVCPGGGYTHRANHEGEKIAKWLNSINISAFVLNYRVAPYKHPVEITDAKRAIRFVRYNAQKFNIFENKIGIMGFSAGGHLACSVAEHYDKFDDIITDEIDNISARPDICVLCYPVISLEDEIGHQGSALNLTDGNIEIIELLSCEKNVHKDMPSTFIWHTVEDASVNVINSIEMSKALKQNNIPFELHIFPNGRHGLALAEDISGVCQWTSLFKNWLKEQNYIL